VVELWCRERDEGGASEREEVADVMKLKQRQRKPGNKQVR
jgi:hypothetical protein